MNSFARAITISVISSRCKDNGSFCQIGGQLPRIALQHLIAVYESNGTALIICGDFLILGQRILHSRCLFSSRNTHQKYIPQEDKEYSKR